VVIATALVSTGVVSLDSRLRQVQGHRRVCLALSDQQRAVGAGRPVHALDADAGAIGQSLEGFETLRRVLDGVRTLVGETGNVINSDMIVLPAPAIDSKKRRSERQVKVGEGGHGLGSGARGCKTADSRTPTAAGPQGAWACCRQPTRHRR